MSLAGRIQITDQDIRTTSTAAGGEYLGQSAETADGRRFRYASNQSTSLALSPGKLTQGAVVVTAHTNTTGFTLAAGASSSSFSVGATAATVDQYRGGYLVVNAGTGAGQALLIRGNTKAAISGTATIYLKDFVITATLASDSKFSLQPQPYSACLIWASGSGTWTAAVTGVPPISIAAATTALPNNYFWNQTAGICSVLSDAGAAVVGSLIMPSDDTDGAVGPYEVDTNSVPPIIGYTPIAGVSAEYRPVYLTIN